MILVCIDGVHPPRLDGLQFYSCCFSQATALPVTHHTAVVMKNVKHIIFQHQSLVLLPPDFFAPIALRVHKLAL